MASASGSCTHAAVAQNRVLRSKKRRGRVVRVTSYSFGHMNLISQADSMARVLPGDVGERVLVDPLPRHIARVHLLRIVLEQADVVGGEASPFFLNQGNISLTRIFLGTPRRVSSR